MLYLATSDEQPLRRSAEISVEEVEPSRDAVRQWFSLPTIRFIGAHTDCSCGFPSVVAAEPVEYFVGMFDDDEDREADLTSVDALLVIIREHVAATGGVELYPVWDGEESSPPKGVLTVDLESLDRETFFLNQHFLYRVTADAK
jgi:hypothetical protein